MDNGNTSSAQSQVDLLLAEIERGAERWRAKGGDKLLEPYVTALKAAHLPEGGAVPRLRDTSESVERVDEKRVAQAFGVKIAGTKAP